MDDLLNSNMTEFVNGDSGKTEEHRVLKVMMRRRELMLAQMFGSESGVEVSPDKRDIRLANEVITAQETATLKLIELNNRENDGDKDLTALVVEALKRVGQVASIDPMASTRPKELDSIEYDILDGELVEDNSELELSKFVKHGEDDE